ncbi:MAG: Inner membrane ABC transporter permease protein YcjP [Alphaproteobacteria bacterium MarineAlpha5_Bin6]|nr:MAG: Inner membrane ABC transporter permease protein YcjP [Alphaproteobacteria bacterium MarineAlpha5_Bin6]|tara:strand:+ start:1140 stop:1967 length:828 start_codon:yes stop_codon:yes gene_type:complete
MKYLKLNVIFSYVALIVSSIFFILPILWMLLQSFKNAKDTIAIPPKIFFSPTLSNYIKVLKNDYFWEATLDSIIVSFMSVSAALAIGIPFAYALTRFNFKGKNEIAHFILSTKMLPGIVIAIPLVQTFNYLSLLDTHIGVSIAHILLMLAVIVWVMRAFLQNLPIDLEEAALIDGASRLKIIWSIVLPIARPGIVTVTALSFLFSWNDLFFGLTLASFDVVPLPIYLTTEYIGYLAVNWGELSAAGLLATLPIILIVILLRENLIRGLSMGAIKG